MWTVEGEIDDALDRLSLPESEMRRCDEEEAVYVQEQAMQKFVSGKPRVWWLSLKTPWKSFPGNGDDIFEKLREIIPVGEDRCWFIPETEGKVLPVFEGSIKAVSQLLEESCFFEYYLVGKKIDWILIENDHNEIFFSRASG